METSSLFSHHLYKFLTWLLKHTCSSSGSSSSSSYSIIIFLFIL